MHRRLPSFVPVNLQLGPNAGYARAGRPAQDWAPPPNPSGPRGRRNAVVGPGRLTAGSPIWPRGPPDGRQLGLRHQRRKRVRLGRSGGAAAHGGLGTARGRTPRRSWRRARRSGVNGLNPVRGGSSPRQRVPKMGISPDWPLEVRPTCSPGVSRPPASTGPARPTRGLDPRGRLVTCGALPPAAGRRGGRVA